MINLFFKKKEHDVEVQAEVSNSESMRAKAEKGAAIEYAKAHNYIVKEQLKNDLKLKYGIDDCSMSFDLYYEEKLLLDAILKDIAASLDLLLEVPNDK